MRRNVWGLSSEDSVGSLDLRRHLDWLLDRLLPRKEALRALQAEPGMKMRVTCVWWSADGHSGPVLWPVQMQGLAELGLECAFDVYFFGDEDEEDGGAGAGDGDGG